MSPVQVGIEERAVGFLQISFAVCS